MTAALLTTSLVLQAASCFLMTGVILVIQLIHYPCFIHMDRQKFPEFHKKHTAALGLIAGPLMILEFATAVILLGGPGTWQKVNLLTVVILWAITFFISVPAHNKLALGFDHGSWRKLVSTNWMRTVLWSGRSVFYFFLLLHLFSIHSFSFFHSVIEGAS